MKAETRMVSWFNMNKKHTNIMFSSDDMEIKECRAQLKKGIQTLGGMGVAHLSSITVPDGCLGNTTRG
jgi:hypothetical protein